MVVIAAKGYKTVNSVPHRQESNMHRRFRNLSMVQGWFAQASCPDHEFLTRSLGAPLPPSPPRAPARSNAFLYIIPCRFNVTQACQLHACASCFHGRVSKHCCEVSYLTYFSFVTLLRMSASSSTSMCVPVWPRRARRNLREPPSRCTEQ